MPTNIENNIDNAIITIDDTFVKMKLTQDFKQKHVLFKNGIVYASKEKLAAYIEVSSTFKAWFTFENNDDFNKYIE